MDVKKQKAFNEKMGKRQKFSQGGLIKRIAGRHYYDAGGSVLSGPSNQTVSSAPTTQGGLAGGIANLVGANNPYQAGAAPLQQGTNSDQLQGAYNQAQGGLGYQQALVNQAAGQNGFGNQNSVYNQQQAIANNMVNAGGLANQQAAAQGFQNIANGTGPNVAQTALNMNTAQNVQNQAALMAGQRGAGANAGLLARQAAQQGAMTQQQAVGQAANLQAQQQQAAYSNLGNLGNTQVGQLQAQQNSLAGTANNQINAYGQAVTGYNNATQGEQNVLQGANNAHNNNLVGMQSNVNNVNSGVSQGNQQSGNNFLSGALNGISGLFTSAAHGGEIHGYDNGGQVNFGSNQVFTPSSGESPNIGSSPQLDQSHDFDSLGKGNGPLKGAYDKFKNWQSKGAGGGSEGTSLASGPESSMGEADLAPAADASMAFAAHGGNICQGPHKSHVANYLAQGGQVPAMVSPGEIYLNPEEVKRVIEHGEDPLKIGTRVPGKAKVKGDNLKNDTVAATLQEGGVVVPRHIMKHKSSEKAELFVRRAVHMKKAGK